MDKTMTLQAAIDDEFRTELMADPTAFDAVVAPLPDSVEQPDQESLELWTKGAATEIYACPYTCAKHTSGCVSTY